MILKFDLKRLLTNILCSGLWLDFSLTSGTKSYFESLTSLIAMTEACCRSLVVTCYLLVYEVEEAS